MKVVETPVEILGSSGVTLLMRVTKGDSDKVEGCQAVTSLRLSPSCGQGRGCQAKAGKDALMLKDQRGKDRTAAPNRVLHLTAETSSQRGLAARTGFCL